MVRTFVIFHVMNCTKYISSTYINMSNLISKLISFPGTTKTNYDLKFTGKENDFVEFKDLPKLNEVTVAFWVKTSDKTKKGTIFSYSVPGKRNALTLADPNGLRLYVNGDDKDGMHK